MSSCSKKKDTFVKRTYHNITAHYNAYFNARVKIDQFVASSEASFKDRYDEILPVYKIERSENAAPSKGANQVLDEAIKKASIDIQRHEISRWVDDCYFEIGRANFYKKDYYTAAENFQFIAGKYKGTETGNKSYIWMIRCYLQLKKPNQAEQVINVALASETFPKEHLPDLFTAIAAFHIDKKNYPKAIEYLDKGAKTHKKKKVRARLTYISAQLNEKIEEDRTAAKQYLKVLSLNPGYEMGFNARMNSARLSQSASLGSRKNLEKEFLKMLKDDKNKDYRDQIYYALGLIYQKDNNEIKAIAAFKASASNGANNLSQRGKTYLRLATIYYDNQTYDYAQYYYDSASTFLSKTHPEYDLVVKRKVSLLKLVENLNIIEREDSLLRVAKMPEAEQQKLVAKIIADEKRAKEKLEQEERERAELALSNISKPNQTARPGAAPTGSGSIWYFYNQNAVSLGTSEFNAKWGKRTLEDNWRRSNKQSYASIVASSTEAEESTESNEASAEKGKKKNAEEEKKKKYLNAIPNTPAAKEASADKIVRAYYAIGLFYREDIINLKESVKAYETALKRFPDNKLQPEIYFNLYRVYGSLNNPKQSEYYKNKILNEYPNSLLAKVIIDPNYVSEAKALDKDAQKLYDSVYNLYRIASYDQVLGFKPSIDSMYAGTSIGPKYYLLYALSNAKVHGNETLTASLNDLINKYPSSDAASRARDMLQKIMENSDPNKKVVEEGPLFSTDLKGKFFVIITTDMKSIVRETKNNLQRFNTTEFSLTRLSISSELIGENNQVIVVREFDQLPKANDYIRALKAQALDVIAFGNNNYGISVITETNYKLLMGNKEVLKYLEFYRKNYPKE